MKLVERCDERSLDGLQCQLLRDHLCMHRAESGRGEYRWSTGVQVVDPNKPCMLCPYKDVCEHRIPDRIE